MQTQSLFPIFFCDTVRYCVVLCDTFVMLCDTLWYLVILCASLRCLVILCDTLWSLVILCDTLWNLVILCDTLRSLVLLLWYRVTQCVVNSWNKFLPPHMVYALSDQHDIEVTSLKTHLMRYSNCVSFWCGHKLCILNQLSPNLALYT